MGFDNECIVNIQSLAGEYFCPVCRTLVYPHEAIQTQCTHLYCKPCLSYVVSSTQACPYDGYLVTEAGSKPLMESNKALAESIGKITVHCLYHRSGCMWQGPLSDCTIHCSGCAFGNSPVVCNRCGIQIVHRQVQEHAQTCNVNGAISQPQQGTETTQDAAASGVSVTTDQGKIANQAPAPASQQQGSHTFIGPSGAQNLNQPATANPLPQAMPATAVPTPEQQYQQYYQQYPGYDPYQQGYQQYYPYQQPPLPVQGQQVQQPQLQQQAQAPMQLPPQVQPQTQSQNPPLTQVQGQGPPPVPSNGQPQPLYPQQGQVTPPGHMPPQSYSQVQPHPVQHYPQPHMQVPQYQQPHPQIVQPHPHFQPPVQSQPMNLQHPPVHQHAPPPQQHPVQVQPLPTGSLPPAQFPPPPPPPPPHMLPHMLPPQQRPSMHQVQQPMPPQYLQQPQAFPGQLQGQLHHGGPFAQQQSQVHQPGPPQPMQQPALGFGQPHQGVALQHAMPPHSSQSYVGRLPMLNQGIAPPHARPPQFGPSQPSVNQSNLNLINQPHIYSEQQLNQYSPLERRVEQQEDKSPSMKKPESVANDFGANFNEVKPDTGMNNDRKPGNEGEVDHRKDEALTKDAVELQNDSVTTQRVKEERKYGPLDHSPVGNSSQIKVDDGGVATSDSVKQGETGVNFQGSSEVNNGNLQGPLNGRIGDVSDGFPSKVTKQSSHPAPHPIVSYGLSEQQQRPPVRQPPSHLRPPGPSYSSHGPHSGEHFHPLGPHLTDPFQDLFRGPNNFPNHSRGYEPQSRFSMMSQGEPLGPQQSSAPPSHGPNTQTGPRHPGPMDFDMYQNQRSPHFDNRRPDSHITGNLERGQYVPPFGVESNSVRMNRPPPPGYDSSSAPIFHDEKFRTVNHEQDELKGNFKQLPGPTHFGNKGSPKFGSHSSRPLGPTHGPNTQTGPRHPGPMDFDMYQNQRSPHFDNRRPDSHITGNLERGQYVPPFGVESNSVRMNRPPPPGYDSSSAPIFHDEKFRTVNHEQDELKGNFKQLPGPTHFGNKGSPKFGSHSSRPLGGYGRDGTSRFLDKDPHRYIYPSIYDNRGSFDNNRHNPDFSGPMHGFGRHYMDLDRREMDRHPFDKRYSIGPPGHMHRGEFDGPGKPRTGESFGFRNISGQGDPGFGSFHDFNRPGESNGPKGFPHQPPFGESFGTKSSRPHLGKPGFRSSYSHKGFSSDGEFYPDGPDSFDPGRKRKTSSMGWCRICKIDCESVEGLDMHGQTHEHQRMAMDMVITIKQKNTKKLEISSNDHTSREEVSKLRNAEHANMS